MSRISEIINKYKNIDFKYGTFDCCIFTAKVIEEYHNIKLPKWRKVLNYKNWEQSKNSLKALGCKRLEDLPDVMLMSNKQDAILAKNGDPVLYINERGASILGVCNGVRAYFLRDTGGLTARKLEECKYSWSVN